MNKGRTDGWTERQTDRQMTRGFQRAANYGQKEEKTFFLHPEFLHFHTLLMASQEKAVTLSPECNLNKKTKCVIVSHINPHH